METASKLSTRRYCPSFPASSSRTSPSTPRLFRSGLGVPNRLPRVRRVDAKVANCIAHYERTVSDVPWAGRVVRMYLRVRRFRCANRECPRRIFAERLPSVVEPYARRTVRLREILLLVGFVLGREAGARLAERIGVKVSPSTLLRNLHAAALPAFDPPEVIGVDDFALLKGRKYGTIIVDFEGTSTRLWRIVPAETLAAWLKEFFEAAHHRPRPLHRVRAGHRGGRAAGDGSTRPLAVPRRSLNYQPFSCTPRRVQAAPRTTGQNGCTPWTPYAFVSSRSAAGSGN